MRLFLVSCLMALVTYSCNAHAKPAKAPSHRVAKVEGKPTSDEVESAKIALGKAKAHAKIARAIQKARVAIEACETAVYQACVAEHGGDETVASCEDTALRADYKVCH